MLLDEELWRDCSQPDWGPGGQRARSEEGDLWENHCMRLCN